MTVPVLYKNDAHPWVQQLAIVGQLQTQYAYGSDASGKFGTADVPDDSSWGNIEVRRMRLGMKGLLFHKLFFLNLTELEPDLSPRVYRRIIENYAIWMHSDALHISSGNGIILPTRYEAYSPGAGDKRGDRWFANYAGLNYHIDGHRLKLMSGVKYSYLDGGPGGGDFNGWTWLAGLRMAF